MVASGFRRCGNLSFINQFSKKYYQLASTASNIKGCQYSTWYFMILTKNICFQNIKIKLNLITSITLKSSVLIFRALEPLQPHWPHRTRQPHWPKQPPGPFLWNGSSKINFFFWYISDVVSVGGTRSLHYQGRHGKFEPGKAQYSTPIFLNCCFL